MANIKINEKNRTIEIMGKKYAEAASRYGTEEYNDLQAARRDYPNYKVVTKSTPRAKSQFKGLTYDYMKAYIIKHDNPNGDTLKAFNTLCGVSDEAKAVNAKAESYTNIKKWFLNTYPEIEALHKKQADLLSA